jgi:hypothetical protein
MGQVKVELCSCIPMFQQDPNPKQHLRPTIFYTTREHNMK